MSDNLTHLNTGYEPEEISRNEMLALQTLVFDLIAEIDLLRDRVTFLTSALNQITKRE